MIVLLLQPPLFVFFSPLVSSSDLQSYLLDLLCFVSGSQRYKRIRKPSTRRTLWKHQSPSEHFQCRPRSRLSLSRRPGLLRECFASTKTNLAISVAPNLPCSVDLVTARTAVYVCARTAWFLGRIRWFQKHTTARKELFSTRASLVIGYPIRSGWRFLKEILTKVWLFSIRETSTSIHPLPT